MSLELMFDFIGVGVSDFVLALADYLLTGLIRDQTSSSLDLGRVRL